MKSRTIWTIGTLAIAALVIVYAFLLVGCDSGAEPPPAGGTTNFDNLAISDDVTVGDDLTVTDDSTLTGALSVGETSSLVGAVTLSGALNIPVDTEHQGIYTVDAATVITSTDGALWTVGASEVWIVQAVYCETSTNFDCTGDDCTLTIGDGNDADGFLVLTDAEMQAADAEFTGAPAGWHGLHTDSIGAYLSGLAPFVYDGTDTIDIAIEDSSSHEDPTAGAATCYVVYLRID